MTKRNEKEVLEALLNVEDIPEKDVFMKRFNVHFTIRALDGEVINRISEQATFKRIVKGKEVRTTDEQLFAALVVKEACLVPNFQDKALLDKYNTIDATDVVKKRLLAGEMATLSTEIMELSGFDDETDENLKNS